MSTLRHPHVARPRWWAVGAACAALLPAVLTGCARGGDPAARPVVVEVLDVQFPPPALAPDVVYMIGWGPEDTLAAFFSSASLAEAGGPSCAAGATASVSPYPLGRIVVARESPEQMALETASDPDDGLGEFLVRLGDRYVYYTAPPEESCRPDDPGVVDLQRRQTEAVKDALRQATSV